MIGWPDDVADRFGPFLVIDRIGPNLLRGRLPKLAGMEVAVKQGPSVDDEADGLIRLAGVADDPIVPSLVFHRPGLLVTEWIGSRTRTEAAEASLGARLATLHRVEAGAWGGGSSWIGSCRVDASPAASAPDFYGRRLSGLLGSARLGPSGTAAVERVIDRLGDLIPPSTPRLVHGDLWWGNVVWGIDGPMLIDPSVHAGHPEEDLAMLHLFGPLPAALINAYCERQSLESGWRDRLELWQLYPLLVHSVLFGGGYRHEAESIARRFA